MIESKIFEMPKNENLTKLSIEEFFASQKINVVKWSVAKVLVDKIYLLVSFEKKAL